MTCRRPVHIRLTSFALLVAFLSAQPMSWCSLRCLREGGHRHAIAVAQPPCHGSHHTVSEPRLPPIAPYVMPAEVAEPLLIPTVHRVGALDPIPSHSNFRPAAEPPPPRS